MFVAIKQNGDYISLVEKWKRTELIEIRKREIFQCPACLQEVHLKIGTKKITHFAHKVGANCTVKTEAESEYHLQGKKQLYHWFQSQNIEVELEKYLEEITQRPDVLVTTENQTYAIEFQCSQIDPDLFRKRTENYHRIGIQPIWILAAKSFKRISANSISISPFQWLFLCNYSQTTIPRIIYYCPLNHQFLIASKLTPFTSNETFCSIHLAKGNDLTFSELLFQSISKQFLSPAWIRKKSKWRLSYSRYHSIPLKHFLLQLYEKRIPATLLPAEIGIPVQSMYWIKTPSMIWQMWILLDIFFPTEVGEMISFHEVKRAFSQRVFKGDIQIRFLPQMKSTHYSYAILEYLQQLTKLGILKKVDHLTFYKLKEVVIPTTLQELYDLDDATFRKI